MRARRAHLPVTESSSQLRNRSRQMPHSMQCTHIRLLLLLLLLRHDACSCKAVTFSMQPHPRTRWQLSAPGTARPLLLLLLLLHDLQAFAL